MYRIGHTLDISDNEELMADFEGQDELELVVEVEGVDWDEDIILDIEIGDVYIFGSKGALVKVEGAMYKMIVAELATDEGLENKVRLEEEERAEDNYRRN